MSAVLFIVFIIFLIIGAPIAVSLSAGSFMAVGASKGIALMAVGQKLFTSIDSFTLMAIPFFMLAGALMSSGGISKRLVDFVNSVFGWMPGGLGVVTVFSCMLFGALSGSPTATAAAIGSIMVPALLEAGYSMGFSLATVATSGILGCIIPPSAVMITYSSATDVSVGDMFIGGILPGIVLGLGMAVVCVFYGKIHKIKREKFVLRKVGKSFLRSIGALLMPVIILGGIYSGIFTPTESAAIACVYGLIVGCFIYREIKVKDLFEIVMSSASSAGMIMFIVAAAGVFGFIMAFEQLPAKLAEVMLGISSNYVVFLLLVNVLLLIVGCFLETTAAVLILAPILYPMLAMYNINPVHFGLVMIINLAIGMLTPPLGVNLFVAAGLKKQPVEVVINKYLLLYIVSMLISLMLITFIPQIVLWLPGLSH